MKSLFTCKCFLYLVVFLHFNASCFAKEKFKKMCYMKNIVPYKIYGGFSDEMKVEILKQMEAIHEKTCIKWVDVDTSPLYMNVTNYVSFKVTTEIQCSTRKGYFVDDGKFFSEVRLNEECMFKRHSTMHELMHALGFSHEHQRRDRDCYVEVYKGLANNPQFRIRPSEAWVERFPYDKYSVMQYKTSNLIKVMGQPNDLPWPLGQDGNTLTDLDEWKLLYKFCGAPHYCDVFPGHCLLFEGLEDSLQCRQRRRDGD